MLLTAQACVLSVRRHWESHESFMCVWVVSIVQCGCEMVFLWNCVASTYSWRSLLLQYPLLQFQPSRTTYTAELHAGPNFKTRPDPTHENRDPTRPDPMTIHDGQKRLSSAYTQVTSSKRKTIRSSYAVVALYIRLSVAFRDIALWVAVTTECRLTCTLETSVVWLSSYLLWLVRGLAIKKSLLNNSY